MEPLIIAATPNISWLYPKVKYPKTPDEIAEEAAECHKAGASILHVHAEGMWTAGIRAVRKKSRVILRCSMSSLPVSARNEVFTRKADMISIMLGHHDEAFAGLDTHQPAGGARVVHEVGFKL